MYWSNSRSFNFLGGRAGGVVCEVDCSPEGATPLQPTWLLTISMFRNCFQNAWKQFLNIEIVNNHVGCNGVAPSGEQSTSQTTPPALPPRKLNDRELLQYITQQRHGELCYDREWLKDIRKMGYE